MKQKLLFFAFYLVLSGLFPAVGVVHGQRATAVEIRYPGDNVPDFYGGQLYATVGGKKRKIAKRANDAWIINRGKEVVYSARDGAGGYENEGQSLSIYDVRTRKDRLIMSEYFYVTGITEKRLSTGANAILVRLEDGGLGGAYFALLDPKRGEVFFRRWAELREIKGDFIKLAVYGEEDWEKIHQERSDVEDNKTAIPPKSKVKPQKVETYDLKKLIKRKVIVNKRDNG